MKKIAALMMAAVSLLAMSLLGGCSTALYEYEKEEGFFVYKKYKGEDHVVITGFTELGNQQEVIVMPETIDGCKYNFFYNKGQGYGVDRFITQGFTKNDNLKKIYFEYEMYNNKWGAYDYRSIQTSFFSFFNVKIIVNNVTARGAELLINQNELKLYSNYMFAYRSSGETKTYNRHYTQLANVEFMYNYEEAPNYGYYWIDDIEDGEKIEIIPPEPEREGYTFAGWYCEPECEREWDFNTAITKPQLVSGESYDYGTKDLYRGDPYPDDYVTYIYAKWI